MLTIGIDSGSTTTKGVLYDGRTLLKQILVPTSHKPKVVMQEVYEHLLHGHAEESVYTVTTGYGRELLPAAHKKVTEITCHGKGAAYLGATVGADIGVVIDIGGQDSKVVLLDTYGNITDFLMNDKCAAGTGRFVEVIMRQLKEDVAFLDQYVAGSLPVKISSMCTVFAESEVIGLLADNVRGGAIAHGILNAISDRTANFAKKLPLEREVFFSGGLAQSEVVRKLLEDKLGHRVVTHPLAQFTGAIGAALIGHLKSKR